MAIDHARLQSEFIQLADVMHQLRTDCPWDRKQTTNYGRHLGISAEDALRNANRRFDRRFRFVEQRANEQGHELTAMTLKAMEELWVEAKREEREATSEAE